jgi:hypothetical protein
MSLASSRWYWKSKKNRDKITRLSRKRSRNRYKKGLCRKCDNPRDGKFTLCEVCRAVEKERLKNIRIEKAELGLCLCCDNEAEPNKSRCRECLDKNKAYMHNKLYANIPRYNQYSGWRYL